MTVAGSRERFARESIIGTEFGLQTRSGIIALAHTELRLRLAFHLTRIGDS